MPKNAVRSETVSLVSEWLVAHMEAAPGAVVTHREIKRRLVAAGVVDERRQIPWTKVFDEVVPRLPQGVEGETTKVRRAKLRFEGEGALTSWVGARFQLGA